MSLANVDLPAPVGPTSASFSPIPTVIETSFRAGTFEPAYENEMPLTFSAPLFGKSTAEWCSSTSGFESRIAKSLFSAAPEIAQCYRVVRVAELGRTNLKATTRTQQQCRV